MSPPVGGKRYVLLLRGINVGGRNRLPMVELKQMLSELGLGNISHYIQSGNLVFTLESETTDIERTVEVGIADRFGLDVPAMVLTGGDFNGAVDRFPFTPDEADKSVLVFLSGPGSHEWADRASARTTGDERYERAANVAYLYCPNGLAKSKAAEALLASPPRGIKATMRNWRTVNKIVEMIAE